MEEALGFWPNHFVRDLVKDYEPPLFDFDAVEKRSGVAIKDEARTSIQDAYAGYAFSILKQLIAEAARNGEDFGTQQRLEIDQSEFKALTTKIQKTAKDLRGLVDDLAEFDAGLLARPQDNRDYSYMGSGPRQSIEKMLGCRLPSYTVDQQGFADIFAFRKLLDYLENFEICNEPFNNAYDLRYSNETDYSNFEFLVRQIVIALQRGGYPTTITIPTDTNPHYESPIIGALLEFQRQANLAYASTSISSLDFTQHYNYRQFSHLVRIIIRQLDALEEIFAHLRRQS